MYVSLSNIINPMNVVKLRDMVSLLSQNTVTVCNQITVLILYCISHRLINLLKIIDASLQVSDVFDFTVSFKFIDFSFHIFDLFSRNALHSALIRHTEQPFTESDDTRCCDNTICPPEDGHVNARNISRIVM